MDATSAMVGRICPPGEDRVKVSENLGGTSVAPVAPVDTSLHVCKKEVCQNNDKQVVVISLALSILNKFMTTGHFVVPIARPSSTSSCHIKTSITYTKL